MRLGIKREEHQVLLDELREAVKDAPEDLLEELRTDAERIRKVLHDDLYILCDEIDVTKENFNVWGHILMIVHVEQQRRTTFEGLCRHAV